MSSWKLVYVFFVEHSKLLLLEFLKLLLLLLFFLLLVWDFKNNRDDDVNDDIPLVLIVVLFSKVYYSGRVFCEGKRQLFPGKVQKLHTT